MKTIIISVCLMLVALPSLAEDYWEDRVNNERALAQTGPVPVVEVWRGKFNCHDCPSRNNFSAYMWAALKKLDIKPGQYLHIYTPDGKRISIKLSKGPNAATMTVTRAGSIMAPNTVTENFPTILLIEEKLRPSTVYTVLNRYDAVTWDRGQRPMRSNFYYYYGSFFRNLIYWY